MVDTLSDAVRALARTGVAPPMRSFARPELAWSEARALVDAVVGGDVALDVIGDFVLPPVDAPPSRSFQTLHFDFGLPLVPLVPADIARFTALHVPAGAPGSGAITRLVPLRSLLAARVWPSPDQLLERFAAYGRSHGAWDDSGGYVEGSLARVVEAAIGDTPTLPSVKAQPDFLCGMEFASLPEETEFFAERGLHVEMSEIHVRLSPGELLVFDNLMVAHGRRGARRPGELGQRVFGRRLLPVEQQIEIRDRLLVAFAGEVEYQRWTSR